MTTSEAIDVFKEYLTTKIIPRPMDLIEASKIAIKVFTQQLEETNKQYHSNPTEEQKPEVKHIGWVARDSEYNPYLGLGLVLFKGKPIRSGDCWTGVIDSQLPWESFPDLKWEDEPIEVEVEVTIRKKIDINSI